MNLRQAWSATGSPAPIACSVRTCDAGRKQQSHTPSPWPRSSWQLYHRIYQGRMKHDKGQVREWQPNQRQKLLAMQLYRLYTNIKVNMPQKWRCPIFVPVADHASYTHTRIMWTAPQTFLLPNKDREYDFALQGVPSKASSLQDSSAFVAARVTTRSKPGSFRGVRDSSSTVVSSKRLAFLAASLQEKHFVCPHHNYVLCSPSETHSRPPSTLSPCIPSFRDSRLNPEKSWRGHGRHRSAPEYTICSSFNTLIQLRLECASNAGFGTVLTPMMMSRRQLPKITSLCVLRTCTKQAKANVDANSDDRGINHFSVLFC